MNRRCRLSTRGGSAAAALYLLLALLYTGPGLLPGRVLLPLDLVRDAGIWKEDPTLRAPVSNRLLSDPVLLYRPEDVVERRELARGRFPWTNPFAADGVVLFANPSAAQFSPFTWIRIALGDRGWAVTALLKLVLAGLGARRFALRLGASARAALLSGVVYELSGYSVLWALHQHSNVFPLLPWLAAAGHAALARPSPGAAAEVVLWAALATAGGHPETLAFGVCAVGIFLALEIRAGTFGARPRFALLPAAAACGLGLLAVQLVPFGLVLAESRIVELREIASHGAPGLGARPFAAAGLVLPGFLGSPLASEIDLTGAFPGSENLHNRSGGFVGFIVLVLCVLWARSLRDPFRRCLAVAAGCLAVVLGVPPVGWIWVRAPVLSLFAPTYAAAPFVLFASCAAGEALSAAADDARVRRWPAFVLIAGGAFLAAAGLLSRLPAAQPAISRIAREGIEALRVRGHLRQASSVYAARFDRYLAEGRVTLLRRVALPGAAWIVGGAALLARRRRLALLCTAAAGELITFGLGYLPAVPASADAGPAPAIRAIQARTPGDTEMIAASEDVYPPDLGTVDRLRDARSYDLLVSRRWDARLRPCGYEERVRAFPDPLTRAQASCLASLGVRYFLSREPPPGSIRIGGGAPPAVGAYELAGFSPTPPPGNAPPEGLRLGVVLSLAALAGAAVVIRAAARPAAV